MTLTAHPDVQPRDDAAPDRRAQGRYAALGRFCYRHRRAVLIGWAVLFVVGIASEAWSSAD